MIQNNFEEKDWRREEGQETKGRGGSGETEGDGMCGRERGEGEQILELGRRADRDAESVIDIKR